MPYDIVAANSRATQVGAALGQAMFNNSLRMQQLQSEQAMQRLQQQQAAENLAWTMRQHHEAIDKEADDAKRSSVFAAMITPTINMPVMSAPDGTPISKPVANPNYVADWGEAYFKAMQGSNEPIAKVATVAGALSLHQSEAMKQRALANEATAPGANGPGTVQQVTGSFPGAPTLNVFVPPRGRGGVQLVGDGLLQTVTGDDGRTYERMKDGSLKPLAATPDQQNAGRTKQKIISEALKIDPAQVGIDGTVTPEGWATIQAKGQVTPATRNVVEKQVVAGEQVIAAATDALDTIASHPEAVGLRGAIGGAIERGKGQLGMETNATTAKARQKLELAFTRLAPGLKVDSGNMSRYERNKLEEVGDPSRWQESPQTATGMMENILHAAIGQQLRHLHDIGKSPNPALLRSIPATEIAALIANHLLTDEEAFKWRELRRQK